MYGCEELVEPSMKEVILLRLSREPLTTMELVPVAMANGYTQLELQNILGEMVEEGLILQEGMKYRPVSEIEEENNEENEESGYDSMPLAGD